MKISCRPPSSGSSPHPEVRIQEDELGRQGLFGFPTENLKRGRLARVSGRLSAAATPTKKGPPRGDFSTAVAAGLLFAPGLVLRRSRFGGALRLGSGSLLGGLGPLGLRLG